MPTGTMETSRQGSLPLPPTQMEGPVEPWPACLKGGRVLLISVIPSAVCRASTGAERGGGREGRGRASPGFRLFQGPGHPTAASSLTRTSPSLRGSQGHPQHERVPSGPSDPGRGRLAVAVAPAVGLARREALRMRRSPAAGPPGVRVPGAPRPAAWTSPGDEQTELRAEGCSAPAPRLPRVTSY